MVNWAIALGAGARSALDTYERLDDMERRENADKRAERALKIQEDAAGRASARFAQEQADRQRALEIAQRFGADRPTPEISTGQAGARTSGALNAPAGDAAPPPAGPTPSRSGALPTPAAEQPRGQRLGLGGLRDEYLRAGLFGHAKDVTNIMNADAEREVSRLRMKVLKGELSDADRKRTQEIYAQETEQLLALGSQLPQDDNLDLTPDMAPLIEGIIKSAERAKGFLDDGFELDFTRNDDGTITVKSIDRETGKPTGEKTLKTVGQLRQQLNMAAALTDPVTAAKWEMNAAIQKREAELKRLDAESKAIDLASKDLKFREELAEKRALDTIRMGMRDPGRHEEVMRQAADHAYILNPEKWEETVETVDPDTGERVKSTRNRLQAQIDRIVPLREVEMRNSKGEVVPYTTEQAVNKYIAHLPDLLRENGGNIPRVVAILKNEHEKVNGFRPGSWEKYVVPIIGPALQQAFAAYRQEVVNQQGTQPGQGQQGGQPQQGSAPRQGLQTQSSPGLSSAPGYWERIQERRRADAEAKAQRGRTRFGDRLNERRMPWEHGLRGQ